MKKVLVVLLTVLFAFSCQNGTTTTEPKALMNISADISSTEQGTANTTSESFNENDRIGVYMDTYQNIPYIFNGSTFAPSDSLIYFADTNDHTVSAYYPYSSGDTIAIDTAKDTADILYATTDAANSKSGASLTFNHKLSKITLTFNAGDGVTEADLKTNGLSYTLSGIVTDGTFTKSTGVITGGTTKGAITKAITDPLTSSVLVIPQSVANIPISVTYNGQTYNGSIGLNNLKEGTNYNIAITVSNVGLSFGTISINSWSDGGTTSTTVTLGS